MTHRARSSSSASSARAPSGHPEYGHAEGIETTTGPLGQGLGNAVGMAIAEESLAARFGRKVVDHHTWVIAGDGCLMEGISHEAIGLAGKQKLSRLIVFWDNNGISIDGKVILSDVTDQKARFAAVGLVGARMRRPRSRRHRPGDRRGQGERVAGADRLPDAHRLRRADQAGHQGGARLAARRRGDRQGPRDLRLVVAAVRDPGGRAATPGGRSAPAARAARSAWEDAARQALGGEAGRVRAGHRRRDAEEARGGAGGVPQDDSRRRRRRSRRASRRRWCSRSSTR